MYFSVEILTDLSGDAIAVRFSFAFLIFDTITSFPYRFERSELIKTIA